jgi:hypothetical protein
MKIASLTLLGLFFLSACAQATPSLPPPVTIENPTSTKTVAISTATLNPTSTPMVFHATYKPTERVDVYPIKKALVIYGSAGRSQYSIRFMEWGNVTLEPFFILYEDGKLILPRDGEVGLSAFAEKQLSQAETQAIISKLEQLGFPQMQATYEANEASLYTIPVDLVPTGYYQVLTMDVNGPKTITYQKGHEPHLIQPMQEIISYLNSFSAVGASPYQPDRLLVSPIEVEEIPDGEEVIPWPENMPSPLDDAYKGLYLEGKKALEFNKATGEYRIAYFSYEGKNYEVYLRPILPHECHFYHYSESNLSPLDQSDFTCEDW